MELECAKYREKKDSSQARCGHPKEYCQHRNSCMIQFIERENRKIKEAAVKQNPCIPETKNA